MGNRIDPDKGMIVFDKLADSTYLAPNGGGTGQSNYTQKEPRPGTVTPVANQSLGLRMSGAQGEDVGVRVQKYGVAGEASIVYSIAAGSIRYGWNAPKLQGYQRILGTSPWDIHTTVVIPETQALVCLFGTYESGVLRRSVQNSNGTWAITTTIDNISDIRAMAMIWHEDKQRLILTTADTSNRLATWFSTDSGVTWSVLESASDMNVTLPDTSNRLRKCYIGNDILLIAGIPLSGTVYQYASSNQGKSYKYVDTLSGTAYGDVGRVNHAKGIFAYLRLGTDVSYRLISNAFKKLSESQDYVITDTLEDIKSISIAVDADQNIYVVVQDDDAVDDENWGYLWHTYFPEDEESWSDRVTWMRTTSDFHFQSALAVFQCGALWLLGSGYGEGTGGSNATMVSVKLTQWSSLEWTGTPRLNWVGLTLPTEVGYTHVGTTTGSISLAELSLNTSGTNGYYTIDFASNMTPAAHFIMRCASGGSVSANGCIFQLNASNGTNTYAIRIRFSSTQFRVLDNSGTVTVATVTRSMTSMTEFKVAFVTAGVPRLWYKNISDIEWTEVDLSAHSWGDLGAIESNWSIDFGHLASTTTQSYWSMVNAYSTHGIIQASANMNGKQIGGSPYPLAFTQDDDDKISFLSCLSGTGYPGEVYSIPVKYQYGINNVFPGSSPATEWRSSSTAEQYITFDLGRRSMIGSGLALLIQNSNIKTAYLESSNNGSSWTTEATYNAAAGMSGLTYAMLGDTVSPAAGTLDSSRYIQDYEFSNGGWLELPFNVCRYISDNSDGFWTEDTTNVPSISFSGYTGTEATSGELNIVADGGLLIYYPSSTQVRRYWRVRIPSQNCPDDFFKAGVIAIGRVVTFGQPWGWGWSQSTEAQYSSHVNSFGTESRSESGDPVTTWSFSFSEGVDQSNLRQVVDADYVGVSGGVRLGGKDTIIPSLAGMIKRTRSQTVPVVAVSKLGTSTNTITDKTLYLYGLLDGSLNTSMAQGEEGSDEVMRVENVIVRQLV